MEINKVGTFFLAIFFGLSVSAQVFSNKEIGKKNKEISDSLKLSEYPYSLPILGEKASKAGYNLPYSAGLSVQYFQQESVILIDNLQVGFNNGTLYNLDGVIRFDEAKAKANAFTFRPDIWLFPFLNVYAIMGTAGASTAVDFGIYVPDSTGASKEVFNTGTVIEFQTTTFGFGLTPTIGVGGGFIALDLNMTWTDVPQLKSPARTFVFGPRFGKSFKLNQPDRNFAVWVGGFRANIQSETNGSMDLNEVFTNDSEFGDKIIQGQENVTEYQMQVDTWWNNLSPLEQNMKINQSKYEAANNALQRASDVLIAVEGALNNISNSTVQYSMNKRLKNMWNFIVGAQFQYNKHLMVRTEFGFLGSRSQGMVGLQYRFGL